MPPACWTRPAHYGTLTHHPAQTRITTEIAKTLMRYTILLNWRQTLLCLLTLLPLSINCAAAGEVYVAEKNGRVVYSDTPQSGSRNQQKIQLAPRPSLSKEDFSRLDAEARSSNGSYEQFRHQEQAPRQSPPRPTTPKSEQSSEPLPGERSGIVSNGKQKSRLNEAYFRRQQSLEK